MTKLLQTAAVAKMLEVSCGRLLGLVESGRMTPPRQNDAGNLLWSTADLIKARQLLAADRQASPRWGRNLARTKVN